MTMTTTDDGGGGRDGDLHYSGKAASAKVSQHDCHGLVSFSHALNPSQLSQIASLMFFVISKYRITIDTCPTFSPPRSYIIAPVNMTIVILFVNSSASRLNFVCPVEAGHTGSKHLPLALLQPLSSPISSTRFYHSIF